MKSVPPPEALPPSSREFGRTVFLLFGIFLLSTWSVPATTIVVPEELSSRRTGDGATSRWDINCLLRKSGDPDLVQCYLRIKRPEEANVSVFLKLKKNGRILSSAGVAGYFKGDRGNAHVFQFALHPDMLSEGELHISTGRGQYLMKLSGVEVLAPAVDR